MNIIKKRIVMGIARHALGALGGVAIGKGWLDGDSVQGLVGVGMTLLATFFSSEDKKTIPEALPLDNQMAALPDNAPIVINNKQQQPTVDVEESYAPPATDFAKGFFLSERSEKNLQDVHPDLAKVIRHAIATAPFDFTVIEGVRNLERQRELYTGKPKRSWTMKSNHLKQKTGYGHAVDLAIFDGNKVDNDLSKYQRLNDHIQNVGHRLGVFEIGWGGHWKMRDGMHWEWKPAE